MDWEVERTSCIDFSGKQKVLEIPRDALTPSDRVLIVDDWSETGGQLRAAIGLAERLGATVIGAACLHIAPRVHQDSRMADYHLHWVINY